LIGIFEIYGFIVIIELAFIIGELVNLRQLKERQLRGESL